MKYVMLAILLLFTTVYGMEGKEVYEKKCASCHALYHPVSELEKNFMEEENKLLNLKAPTINQVVYRLKRRIGDPNGDKEMHKMEIESFLADYFENPNKEKSICLEAVIKHFDTMPKIELSEEERAAILEFLYTYDPKQFQSKKLEYVDYESALKKAVTEQKLVMLFFTAKHCRYCKKMQREVLSDDEVVSALDEGFITVKLDLDSVKNQTKFKVSITPTFIFLSPENEAIYTVPGSWNKEDFLVILKEAKEKSEAHRKKGEKK